MGRGFGRGAGEGGVPATGRGSYSPETPEQELTYLKEDLEFLRTQVKETEVRIAAMESAEEAGPE